MTPGSKPGSKLEDSSSGGSTITLRALEGEPLADNSIRQIIVSTAHAIAERQGVTVLNLETTPDSITVTLKTGRIQSLGFAAELRTLTTRWYTKKFNMDTLWGNPPPEIEEKWKQD